jgi:hypothetical protein
MGPNGTRIQNWLCWRGPASIFPPYRSSSVRDLFMFNSFLFSIDPILIRVTSHMVWYSAVFHPRETFPAITISISRSCQLKLLTHAVGRSWFFSVLPGNAGTLSQIRPRSLLPTSFQIHRYDLIIGRCIIWTIGIVIKWTKRKQTTFTNTFQISYGL